MFRVTRNSIVIAGMMAVVSAGMTAGMIIVGSKSTTAKATARAKVVIAKA